MSTMGGNDPFGLGQAAKQQAYGNMGVGSLGQSAQPYYPDTGYVYAPQLLSVHRLTNGYLIRCGQKVYNAGDDIESLNNAIALALVHLATDSSK